jgi:hypothetical protein
VNASTVKNVAIVGGIGLAAYFVLSKIKINGSSITDKILNQASETVAGVGTDVIKFVPNVFYDTGSNIAGDLGNLFMGGNKGDQLINQGEVAISQYGLTNSLHALLVNPINPNYALDLVAPGLREHVAQTNQNIDTKYGEGTVETWNALTKQGYSVAQIVAIQQKRMGLEYIKANLPSGF